MDAGANPDVVNTVSGATPRAIVQMMENDDIMALLCQPRKPVAAKRPSMQKPAWDMPDVLTIAFAFLSFDSSSFLDMSLVLFWFISSCYFFFPCFRPYFFDFSHAQEQEDDM